MSECALSDRRYIALLCSYTFSVLLLHRCVLFVFPLLLYHSQRTSTPRVSMSISVGNRRDGIFLFCIETYRSVLFVVTPSSCCPCSVDLKPGDCKMVVNGGRALQPCRYRWCTHMSCIIIYPYSTYPCRGYFHTQ